MLARKSFVSASTRTLVRPKCKPENKSAFQLNPGDHEISFLDLETAFELCNSIKKKDERDACYVVFGIDGDAMKKHYPLICKLEHSLYPMDEPFVVSILKRFNPNI